MTSIWFPPQKCGDAHTEGMPTLSLVLRVGLQRWTGHLVETPHNLWNRANMVESPSVFPRGHLGHRGCIHTDCSRSVNGGKRQEERISLAGA